MFFGIISLDFERDLEIKISLNLEDFDSYLVNIYLFKLFVHYTVAVHRRA